MVPSPERIAIEGFKSIRKAEIELRPLNVLIGANGAGKSNFIEVFRLLRHIVDENLQVYVGQSGGADALLHFGRKRTERLHLHVDFGSGGYGVDLVPSVQDSLLLGHERFGSREPRAADAGAVSLGEGMRESLLRRVVNAGRTMAAPIVLAAIEGWKAYHFHDTSAAAAVKQTGELDDNVSLRPDARNLAAFLYLLRERHGEHYRQIVDTVRMAAPFFRDFALQPSRLNPDKIRLEWRHRGTDAYFDASSLSDGTLRFICLATLLLQPALAERETTLIIDEPELGLHPYAITLLAGMLREAAHVATVIVSTQSASLVNQLVPEEVIVVERDGEESVFKRLAEQDMAHWLENYGLGDLWEKNVIGGRPR